MTTKPSFWISLALTVTLFTGASSLVAANTKMSESIYLAPAPGETTDGGARLSRFSCGDTDKTDNTAFAGTVAVRDNILRTTESKSDTCLNQSTVNEISCVNTRSPEIQTTPVR